MTDDIHFLSIFVHLKEILKFVNTNVIFYDLNFIININKKKNTNIERVFQKYFT